MTTVRYLSMFSGIGGFELGIQQAAAELGIRVECVGYSEIDKHAIATYEEHFNQSSIFSLLAFPAKHSPSEGNDSDLKRLAEPSSSTSSASSEPNSPDSSSSKTSKGSSTTRGGRLSEPSSGPLMNWGMTSSGRYSTARITASPSHENACTLSENLGGTPRPKVFPQPRKSNPHTTVGKSTETTVARTFTAGGNSGGNHSGMTILELTGARSQSQRLYDPAGLAPTFSTGGATTGGAEVPKIWHESTIRRLTPMEGERLQGFPDNWTKGSDTQRYKGIGNAVSVPVVKAVARPVLAEATS